ncbi:hypothetical protein GALMADRAFT_231958 [Galerina marginata CBS 339.88]|uniref:Metallo-beta-lactamase domain-containing protein n=1 Tax=Galerina marginata (strain CBS 339.88) TaxID=685588 RepID=A0A067SL94_GALM3|nr:hypothetical protein GALMADRAFT_231958 [Galerina marginata CBS 339.88]
MSKPNGFLHVVQALHGDCLMFEYDQKDGSGFMLIDGGPSRSYQRNRQDYRSTANLFQLLTDLSGTRPSSLPSLEFIDTVVVTHDDADHKDGIADLFKFLLQDTNCPNAIWQTGLNAMTLTPKKLPIKNVWYNSQLNLIKQYIFEQNPPTAPLTTLGWLNASGAPEAGWFDNLLTSYNNSFPPPDRMRFNQEFVKMLEPANTQQSSKKGRKEVKLEPTVSLVAAGSMAKTQIVRKGRFAFKILGPSYAKELMNEKLITELVESSGREATRTPDALGRSNMRGATQYTTTKASPTLDSSVKNRSSIAFVATDVGDGVGSGAKLLMLGDAAIASQIDAGEYNIMKIAHHGSGNNSFLNSYTDAMKTAEIKVNGRALRNAFGFFYRVKARKYVISASPYEGSPNPHFTTILGIYLANVENYIQRSKDHKPVDVYLTNPFPGKALHNFGLFLNDPEKLQYTDSNNDVVQALATNISDKTLKLLGAANYDKYMRIWLLRSDAAYGSIPIYEERSSHAAWLPFALTDLQAAYAGLTGPPPAAGPAPKRARYGHPSKT